MIKKLLATTAILGVLAAGPVMAASGNIDAQATIAAVLGVSEQAPMDFGMFAADGAVGDECSMDTTGVVLCPAGPTHLAGGAPGVLSVTGTPGAVVLIEATDGVNDGTGTIRFLGPKCSTASVPEAACQSGTGFTDTFDGAGNLSVNMGGSLRWLVAAPAAATYTASVPVTVNYQ